MTEAKHRVTLMQRKAEDCRGVGRAGVDRIEAVLQQAVKRTGSSGKYSKRKLQVLKSGALAAV